MEKAIVAKIKTCKKKEKEDLWAKQAIELGFPTKHAPWKTTKKHARAQFTTYWTPTTVAEIGDHIHHDFQAGLQTYMHKYVGVNLGYTTWAQQQARL